MDVMQKVNERLKGKNRVNSHDMQCVRRIHKIDGGKANFFYKPKFGSAQYSGAFIDWIVGRYEQDKEFFEKPRSAYRKLAHNS